MADWSQVRAGMWLGVAMLLSCSQWCADGALNIGAHDAQDLVASLRKSIFVETTYLSERQEERCTSLDGPQCFAFLAGGGKSAEQGRPVRALDGPGVVPEMLLHDLGVESDLEFITPEYSVLSEFSRQQAGVSPSLAQPALTGAVLRSARESAKLGILHFAEMPPGSRVPLSFSRGLPGSVVATWDGSWRVRSCSQDELGLALAPLETPLGLPMPERDGAGAFPNAPALADSLDPRPGSGTVSVVAELTGSVGYLRFSKPVLVRSLFARWRPAEGAPPGLVGGRLGLQGAWTTHLDPKKLHVGREWIDIGGGPLKAVDEVAFVATAGLEVGAVEVVAHSGEGDEDEEQSVIMLAPSTRKRREEKQEEEKPERPLLDMRVEKVTAVAAPYIMSLQEVIDRNLKIDLASPMRERPHTPGLLSSSSAPLVPDTENITWYAVALANQAMFEHSSLLQWMLTPTRLGRGGDVGVEALHGLLSGSSAPLPLDLQTELPNETIEILEAVLAWLKAGGGWGIGTPSSLPRNSTEEALLSYVTAKRWQTKLDLITAAYLHQRPKVDQSSVTALQNLAQALLQQES